MLDQDGTFLNLVQIRLRKRQLPSGLSQKLGAQTTQSGWTKIKLTIGDLELESKLRPKTSQPLLPTSEPLAEQSFPS